MSRSVTTDPVSGMPLRTGRRPLSAPARRALRILFWIMAVVMVLFVAGGFFLPRRVGVKASTFIHAPRQAVFEQLESFKRWEAWGPWFERDRFIEKTFEGPEAGLNARMLWKSKTEGDGQIKIVGAQTGSALRMAVDFGESGDASLAFDLKSLPDGSTEVTWTFMTDFGQNMARRYFGLLLRSAVDRDLRLGLENLKALAENPAAGGAPATP